MNKNKDLSISAEENISANGYKIGVVFSTWNKEITQVLYDGCKATLTEKGVQEEDIKSAEVPGAYELPLAAKYLLTHESLDAVICLGCVIKGDTKHDEYINNAVAQGIMQLSLHSGKPVIFGVLTPNDMQQALDRAGGIHGNKGVEAAMTALKMVSLEKSMSKDKKKIGF
jgi:6,7-dimethyl-8-ribityllumazine synthase